MRPLIQEIQTAHTPESLVGQLGGEDGIVLLRSSSFDSPQARYSFITARPFLTFRSSGSRCEITRPGTAGPRLQIQFGNPWHVLDALMSRFELLDEIDSPFPLGGAFGYWGYDLKNFTEPKLPRRAVNDLELPDCHVGFYDSLVVFEHRLGKICIVSTGLNDDGSRSEARAKERLEFWKSQLTKTLTSALSLSERAREKSFPLFANPDATDLHETLEPFLPRPRRGERAGVRGQFHPISPAPIFLPPSPVPSATSGPVTFIRSTCRNGSRPNAMAPVGNCFRD